MLMGVKCGASGRTVTPVAEKSRAWAERRLHVAHDPDSRWCCPGPKLRLGSSSAFSQDREGSASGPSGSTERCHTVKHEVSCLVSAYVVGGVNHLKGWDFPVCLLCHDYLLDLAVVCVLFAWELRQACIGLGGLASRSRTSERVLRNSGPGWPRQGPRGMANRAGRRGACPVTVCWRGMLMGVKYGASGRAVTPVAEKSGAWAERCLHLAHDPDSCWCCSDTNCHKVVDTPNHVGTN
ncbi:hypothetical protein TIFTF001_037179 [Ficus carica]|uniref:Uncharacterized protein n=1 Tax=Ficus carica TaxID=3494 RepID=A0AA88JDG1_FICCA|nr:hypothetical protein TIFTF001_037179 [Ficus carica]